MSGERETGKTPERLSRRIKKALTARSIGGFLMRESVGRVPALSRRFNIYTHAIAARECAAKVLETRQLARALPLDAENAAHLADYAAELGPALSGHTLALSAEIDVVEVRNARVLAALGAVAHLPSRAIISPFSRKLHARASRATPPGRRYALPGLAIQMLSTPQGHRHYYHFFQLASQIHALLPHLPVDEPVTLLVRKDRPAFQAPVFAHLQARFPHLRLHEVEDTDQIEPERLLLTAKRGTHILSDYADICAWHWLAEVYREAYGITGGEGASSHEPSRLFLSRAGQAVRKLGNEGEILPLLAARGIEALRPETLPHAEQVRRHAEAGLVISTCGAALTNIIFCPPGAKVIEICYCDRHELIFIGLALALGHEYRFVPGSKAGAAEVFTIPSEALAAAIDGLITL